MRRGSTPIDEQGPLPQRGSWTKRIVGPGLCLGLVALFVWNNFSWLSMSGPFWTQSDVLMHLDMANMLTFSSAFLDGVDWTYPPLMHMVGRVFFRCFGFSYEVAILSQIPFILCLALSMYALGRRLGGPTVGVLAVFLALSSTSFQVNSRIFLADLPLTCMVGLWLFLFSEASHRRSPAVAAYAGLAMYLTLLTKFQAAFFLAGPVVFEIVRRTLPALRGIRARGAVSATVLSLCFSASSVAVVWGAACNRTLLAEAGAIVNVATAIAGLLLWLRDGRGNTMVSGILPVLVAVAVAVVPSTKLVLTNWSALDSMFEGAGMSADPVGIFHLPSAGLVLFNLTLLRDWVFGVLPSLFLAVAAGWMLLHPRGRSRELLLLAGVVGAFVALGSISWAKARFLLPVLPFCSVLTAAFVGAQRNASLRAAMLVSLAVAGFGTWFGWRVPSMAAPQPQPSLDLHINTEEPQAQIRYLQTSTLRQALFPEPRYLLPTSPLPWKTTWEPWKVLDAIASDAASHSSASSSPPPVRLLITESEKCRPLAAWVALWVYNRAGHGPLDIEFFASSAGPLPAGLRWDYQLSLCERPPAEHVVLGVFPVEQGLSSYLVRASVP